MGFTITETVMAAAAGAVVIVGGGLALRTVSASIAQSSELESLRTDLTSAERFLRSEVQRSLYIIVSGGSKDDQLDYTDFEDPNHPEYRLRLNECKLLAGDAVFKPMFGLKIAESIYPVIYGLGVSSNGNGYSLMRCGEALNADGRYETESPILTPLLENIGSVPCAEKAKPCLAPTNASGKPLTPSEIVEGVDTSLDADNWSKSQSFMQPALAIKTDNVRKLLKILIPTDKKNPPELPRYSFLQLPGDSSGQGIEIDMAAYAKADNVLRTDLFYAGLSGDAASPVDSPLSCTQGSLCEFYGIPVTSNRVQIVIDGSGSMSSCIAWGSTYNSQSRTYYNGVSYSSTKRNCLTTRMESLQAELRNLLNSLPDTATVSIRSFSSPGYLNDRDWMQGNQMALTDANRTSALAFINSLSGGSVTLWGGTLPWAVMNSAFANKSADTLYILTDGAPNNDLKGGGWSTSDYLPTSSNFLSINNARIGNRLTVNSVSIGLDSPWLQQISSGASGTYKMINQAYTAVQ